jgi:hypothetical protein
VRRRRTSITETSLGRVSPLSSVETWRQSGRLFFWRFTENVRNYPGWHFMLDSTGSISISALVRAMSKSATKCIRTVQVSYPTAEVLQVPNNRSAGCVAPTKLRIELDTTDPSTWSLNDDGVAVHWRFGYHHAATVADAFTDPLKYFGSTIGTVPVLWSWGLLSDPPPGKSLKRTRGR